jgi:hypothetical protein
MEGRIRANTIAEIIPMMAHIKIEATSGTAALVQREVAVASRKLTSQLQDVRREHSVTVSNLETELARLGALSVLYGGQHVCSSLNSDLPANWELVLEFLGRQTSPGLGRVSDKI